MSLSEGYQLVQRLGSGVAGVLYLAESRDGQVAMRQFESPAKSGSEVWQRNRQAFLNAGRQTLGLTHPYIVPVLDVIDEGSEAFIASEYVTAGSLEIAMEGRRFTMEETAPLLRELALALDFAHSHGIVHGNLKPSNVFLLEQGAKVADFALGMNASTDPRQPIPPHMVHRYLSPEHLRTPRLIDPQSDQYSLAVIAYELHTGQSPYGSAMDLPTAILTAEIPPPSRVDSRLPTALDGPLLRALDRDPAHRFGSCVEFVTALGASWKASPAGTSGPRWPIVLGSLAALLLVALGLAYYRGRQTVKPIATAAPAATAPTASAGAGTPAPPAAVKPPERKQSDAEEVLRPATRNLPPAAIGRTAGASQQANAAPVETREPPVPAIDYGVQAFKIQVFSRTHEIQEGSSFAFGDQDLGELADGDIKMAVSFEGLPKPRGPFRVEWAVDGVIHDRYPILLDHLMEFRNEPTPGTYVVTLYDAKRPLKKFAFRITP